MTCTTQTLDFWKKQEIAVKVYIEDPMKKVMLEGKIIDFDDVTILLSDTRRLNDLPGLIYQSKIISIVPR